MPNLVEPMLARWPLLYPEIMGASESDDDLARETVGVRYEAIAPLLEADDVHNAFEETREVYTRWRGSLPPVEGNSEDLLAHEEEKDEVLTAAFGVHCQELGETITKAVIESIRLRRVVRRSVTPERDTWPEESWERIGDLMTKSELCLAGVLEYLATEEGSRTNVDELARLGFENALDAYWDAGYFGKQTTREDGIPWPCP